MGLVGAGRAVGIGRRIYDVDVVVCLHGLAHHLLCGGHLGGLLLVVVGVEIAASSVDGLLEDNRGDRVLGADGLYEIVEVLPDFGSLRIGECVEHKCVGIGVGEHTRIALLELGITAHAQRTDIKAGGALQLQRIGHA